MAALHDAVQHGIGRGLIANPLMPMFDRQLTGNNGGPLACAVINDLQQISPCLPVHGRHAPIVEEKDIGILQDVQPACKRVVGMADAAVPLPGAGPAGTARYGLASKRAGPAPQASQLLPAPEGKWTVLFMTFRSQVLSWVPYPMNCMHLRTNHWATSHSPVAPFYCPGCLIAQTLLPDTVWGDRA